MLKRDITYTDYNGEKVTETFYFNITKTELIEVEVGHDGGVDEWLKRVIASKDNQAILAEFKRIILLAYGEKSPDGKKFVKSKELRDEFEHSPAFDELFMEMFTDANKAADFFMGALPAELSNRVAQQESLPPPNITPVGGGHAPEPITPTQEG